MNTAIVMACAVGVQIPTCSPVMKVTSLSQSTGLHQMGLVKCRASTKAKKRFEQIKEQCLLDIKAIVEIEDIPLDY